MKAVPWTEILTLFVKYMHLNGKFDLDSFGLLPQGMQRLIGELLPFQQAWCLSAAFPERETAKSSQMKRLSTYQK